MAIVRKIGSQDISWFLDQARLGRLELTPPYQRKSVWTSGDRRYFLDTIFHGFPCPPVYLHKKIGSKGEALYDVVDGKQRIETVIRFASENRIRIPPQFGDTRLENMRWKDIKDDSELRNMFLNYTFIVEYFDDIDSALVNEIFERMNKNSRKLTRQELRHARFDGWFSKQVEKELDDEIWKEYGVVTTGRARRMADAQFLSELLMVVINTEIVGFNQDVIDETYAAFDDASDVDLNFDVDNYEKRLESTKRRLKSIDAHGNRIKRYANTASNMYTIWSCLALATVKLPPFDILSSRYGKFMSRVNKLSEIMKSNRAADGPSSEIPKGFQPGVITYYQNNQSATTELPQRRARQEALNTALLT